VLRVPEVVSFTATTNLASQAVMRRIGLRWRGEFEHPRIPEGHALRRHVLYAITAQPGLGGDPGAGSTIAAR
jgi:RimJ/RimL family protein N-acetyltransferase